MEVRSNSVGLQASPRMRLRSFSRLASVVALVRASTGMSESGTHTTLRRRPSCIRLWICLFMGLRSFSASTSLSVRRAVTVSRASVVQMTGTAWHAASTTAVAPRARTAYGMWPSSSATITATRMPTWAFSKVVSSSALRVLLTTLFSRLELHATTWPSPPTGPVSCSILMAAPLCEPPPSMFLNEASPIALILREPVLTRILTLPLSLISLCLTRLACINRLTVGFLTPC